MTNKLNKLQIRAKVFEIIKSYTSEDDFASKLHIENLRVLNEFEDYEFVLEILMKELISSDGFELEAVQYILADYATLEMAENTIWNLLKDKNITDSKKEILLSLLRALGGKIDIPLLMDCMQNFDAVVDQQTQSLLQVAAINPEAQIDFLDFLSSLKTKEQVQLVKSLQDDFKGDELANILSPCLQINISDTLKEEVVEILASSNSYLAVKPIKTFILSTDIDELKKKAFKALNQLQSSGIDIDNDELLNIREHEVCKASKFYKAYLSQVDGCGNQGLIFSRITDDSKIIMFSTVINNKDGIIDCFGLHDISITDFQKVVKRFRDNDMVVPIEASEAKFLLKKAENINKNSRENISYEYLCWSVYLYDIEYTEVDYASLLTRKIENLDYRIYDELYSTEVFDSWFFEYDDNIDVQEFIDYVVEQKDMDISDLMDKIQEKLVILSAKLFTSEKISNYAEMLFNVARIFYINQDAEKANMAANLANAIQNGENRFFEDILVRSVLQYLADTVASQEEMNVKTNSIFSKQKTISISKEDAYKLLRNIEQMWDGMKRYE